MRRRHPHFGKIYQSGAQVLAQSKVSGRAFNTLFALIALADWNGLVYKTRAELAQYIKMDPSNVSKCLNELIRLQIVRKGKRKRYLQLAAPFIQFGEGFPLFDREEVDELEEELKS